MSPDQERKEVGHAIIQMWDNGDVSMDIEGIPYIQMYGVAETMRELARQQQAQTQLESLMKSGKIDIARGIPGMPQGPS